MKRCAKKLHSRRGASILLALFMMLVAVMIAAVVISAALTAANRVKDDTVRQQDALSLSSAETILTKYFQDNKVAKRYSLDRSELSDQIEEMSDPDPNPDNPLKKLCIPENVGKAYTMEVSGVPSGMKGAVMDFVLEQDENDENLYFIKGTIQLEDAASATDMNPQKLFLLVKVSYTTATETRTATEMKSKWVQDESSDDPAMVAGYWDYFEEEADPKPILTIMTWTLESMTASAAEGVLW